MYKHLWAHRAQSCAHTHFPLPRSHTSHIYTCPHFHILSTPTHTSHRHIHTSHVPTSSHTSPSPHTSSRANRWFCAPQGWERIQGGLALPSLTADPRAATLLPALPLGLLTPASQGLITPQGPYRVCRCHSAIDDHWCKQAIPGGAVEA